MTISFISVGTAATGTTSVVATIPTIQKYDFMVLHVGTINAGHTLAVSTSGWNTLNGGGEGGLAQNVKTFYRVADGTESASTVTATISTGTASYGQVSVYRSSNAMPFWAWESTTGTDSTATGTTFSATAGANPDIETNALVIVAINYPFGSVTSTVPGLTATGATIGTKTLQASPANGTTLSGALMTAPCTAGISTAAPVATMTTTTAKSSGVACFTRLDDAPAITDNFTRADSTTALGRTEGTGWFPWSNLHAGANLGISTNRAYSPTGAGRAFLQTGRNDNIALQYTVVSGPTNFNMLAFRIQADTDYWRFGQNTTVMLQKMVAGTPSTVVNTGVAAALNDVFRVELVGNVITCFKNGVQVATTTDAAYNTQMSHGLDLGNLTPIIDTYSITNVTQVAGGSPTAVAFTANNATAVPGVPVAPGSPTIAFAGQDATVTTFVPGTTVNAGQPATAFAASDATTTLASLPTAGQPTVAFAGLDATVSASGNQDAPAGTATLAFAANDATVTVSASTSVNAVDAAVAFAGQDATVTTGTAPATVVDAECPEIGFLCYDVGDFPTDYVYGTGGFPSRRRVKGKWKTIRGISPLDGGQDL